MAFLQNIIYFGRIGAFIYESEMNDDGTSQRYRFRSFRFGREIVYKLGFFKLVVLGVMFVAEFHGYMMVDLMISFSIFLGEEGFCDLYMTFSLTVVRVIQRK